MRNRQEQDRAWNNCVDLVLTRTRWVLDNLENLPEFYVNWEDYHKKGYWKRRYLKGKENI